MCDLSLCKHVLHCAKRHVSVYVQYKYATLGLNFFVKILVAYI